MELNGAFSNPFATDKDLPNRLGELHQTLLQEAVTTPRQPRTAPARRTMVLEMVTLVLEEAARPMRAIEVHRTACELVDTPLLWSSVKGVLSAYTIGGDRRFRRLRRGVYELVG
jgi:hypothetical protein